MAKSERGGRMFVKYAIIFITIFLYKLLVLKIHHKFIPSKMKKIDKSIGLF